MLDENGGQSNLIDSHIFANNIGVRHLKMLLRLGRSCSDCLTIDDILEEVLQIATEISDCERSSLFLSDPQTGELYSRVAQGVNAGDKMHRYGGVKMHQ